ncbi:MAG: hypothetical protein K0B15_01680 [Lentimicrobium sp.]|nr:hypothetical protein [Lentimicrobium sp.]
MSNNQIQQGAPAGAIFGLGFVGATVYFIFTAAGFCMGAIGFLKALVWPAFLVYEAMKQMGM